MTKRFHPIPIRQALAVLAAISAMPLAAQTPASGTGDKLYGQQCAGCHSTTPGEVRVGPSLAGIVGRKAGSAPGYSYSAALAKSGRVWKAASLDKWLAGTQADVPGTKMSYAQADPAQRAAIITYLASLSK